MTKEEAKTEQESWTWWVNIVIKRTKKKVQAQQGKLKTKLSGLGRAAEFSRAVTVKNKLQTGARPIYLHN